MKQKSLAKWLKAIIVGVGICAAIVYDLVLPVTGEEMVAGDQALKPMFITWLIFLLVTAIPFYIALVYAWKVATNIGNDRSFSVDNSNHLKKISYLAAGDSTYFFVGNIVLLFMNMNHPGVLLASLMVTFVGIAVTVASAGLSHLVMKAADLQDMSDATI